MHFSQTVKKGGWGVGTEPGSDNKSNVTVKVWAERVVLGNVLCTEGIRDVHHKAFLLQNVKRLFQHICILSLRLSFTISTENPPPPHPCPTIAKWCTVVFLKDPSMWKLDLTAIR